MSECEPTALILLGIASIPGIHNGQGLCHGVSPTRGHVSRIRPAVRTGRLV